MLTRPQQDIRPSTLSRPNRLRKRWCLSEPALSAMPRREVRVRAPACRIWLMFPLQATGFRQVLPHVNGFPVLGVLRLIRLPTTFGPPHLFGLSRLPVFSRLSALRLRPTPVSGFPLPWLSVRMPYVSSSQVQEPVGPPKFFDAPLHACHALMTPAGLRNLTLVIPLRGLLDSVRDRRLHL